MKFPVDLLADVRQVELERLAHRYMDNLLYSNPDCPEHLTLSDSTQVTIDISSVGFVPLYGSGDKHKILALFSPSDPFTAVALYLLDRWWVVDDILKTADPTRGGAVEVETVGERIVLYILNRVVYRAKEMRPEELPFLCHGEKDNAKILWNDGEAVGFYSVKPAGSFCSAFSTRSYQLPVMDSIFVRKCQRGKGFGLQMLEDFVLSFKEDCLGLRYPVTKFMYKVCEKYLCQYPGDTDLLWEVESIGGPKQRTNIARKIQAMDQSAVSRSLTFTEESLVITERTEKDVVMEAIATQIKETGSMECTVEIVEEVTMLSVTKVSEAEVALTARGRSSGSKRRKMGEKIGEDKSEKVIRIEDIEAESPSKDQVSAQQKTELQFSELVKTESMSSVAPEGQGEDMVDTEPGDAAEMLDRPDTVLAQQDLEDAGVTSSPTTEEPQVEDDAPQNLNNISCDSQITVENVASEIEEECQEEVSEEASEEAETLDKVGEGTQVGVTDEKSEERVTQQENGEAGKTGRAIVKAVTTVQSITPRRSSTRHSKQEEGAKDGGIMLRGRTLRNTPPPTRRYTRRSQKVSEESDKEVDEVEEEKGVSTTEVVEESAVTEGEEEEEEEEEETAIEEDVVAVEELLEETQQLEDEQLKNEEKTEKQQEPGVEDTELPDTAETALAKEHEDETDESESGQNGEEVETSVIQNKADVPENEIEELPAEASAGEEKADEQAAYKQVEEHHQVANDAVTVTVTMEEKQCAVSEICADREADTPVGDDAEGNLPLAEVDEALSLEEEEAPVVEPRALRRKTKTSTATPRRKSTRGRKQVDAQEAENSEEEEEEEEEPAVTTRTLRRGRISTTDTPKGKSRRSRKQIQEETQKGEEESQCVEERGGVEEDAAKEAAVEKTDEEMEEIVDKVKETTSEKEEGLELKIDDVEGQEAVSKQKPDTVEVITGLGSDPPTEGGEGKAPEEELVTAEVEKGESEEGTMTLTEEEEDTETDAPLASPPTDSAVLPPVEEEATPSAEEQQSEDLATQLSDRRRVTVVLVDLQKPHHDVQEEAAATEEGLPVRKTAAEAEEEQREETMKEEETVAQETVPGSEEEGCGDKVEAATIQDPGEGRDEETAKEEEAKSVHVGEQKPIVTETRTPKSGTQAVEGTPRTRGRPRKGQGRKKAASKIQKEEPAVQVRVLRTGRKSFPVAQSSPTKRTRKQLQEEEEEEEEGGEESTAVEAIEGEQQMTDQEKEESLEDRDATEQVENLEAEMTLEKEDTVAEEIEVENEDLVPAEVEKGESEEGTMTLSEDEEDTETDAPLASPPTDSAVLPPVEEEATPSAEEQQSEDLATQLSDRRRVTVVLVDLQKPHHDVQEEAAATEEGLPVRKTAAEAEEEQREETMKEEETVAQETVPGSSLGIEKTKLEKVIVEAVTKEDTEEGSDEETAKAVKATRTRGRPRKVRKEAASKIQIEENLEAETALEKQDTVAEEAVNQHGAQEEGQVDSTGTVADEETEASVEQRDDGVKTLVVAEEAVAKLDTVEGEQSTSTSEVVESKQDTMLTAKDEQEKDASEEEAPVVEQVLRSGKKTVRATARSKTPKRHDDEEEEEEEAPGEKSTEEDEPAVEIRILRKGRKSADPAPRRKSKRARTQCQTEEEEEEETTPPEETQVEETKAVLEETDKKEESRDEDAPQDEGNTEPELCIVAEAVSGESVTEQEAVEENESAAKRQEEEQEEGSEDDEPAVETRVLRKGRRSAAAAPRRKSKRARTQCQQEDEGDEEATPAEEIEGEEEEAGQESPEEKGMEVEEMEKEEEFAVGDAEQTRDASTAEAGVLEEEDNRVDGTGTNAVLPSSGEVEETNSAVEEETAVVEQPSAAAEVGSDAAVSDEEALAEEAPAVAEEDAPAATTRAFRSKQKASPTAPSPRSRRKKDDSPRRSVRKRPKVDYRENEEGERDETEGNTDEERAVPVAAHEEQGNKESECSSNADEVGEAAGSSQEDEEYEQNASEEEEEPIVIGTRVLRGRSVPSVIITPQSKSRRRSANVFNQEGSPRSARKRRSTEVTRKSQRLSRV